jgi:prepilin-type processing-associated H-X9-DG protein
LTQYHNDGLNYCFLDGNVQWIKYSDVTNNLWYGN